MEYKLHKKLMSIFVMLALIISVSAETIDLNNYKSSFVTPDGKFNGKIAVGSKADVSDYISSFSLANSLVKKQVEVVEPTEAVDEEISIGSALASKISQELSPTDIDGLLDSSVHFGSSDYDVSEVIILGQAGRNLTVKSSLTSDEDYQTDVVLEADRDSIKYYYKFDDSIDLSKVSSSTPLEISVLGKKVKITDVVSPTSFTAFVGNERVLNVGDEISVEGKRVKLVNIGENNAIVVSVDGVTGIISGSASREINGVEIVNEQTFYTVEKEGRAAVLVIGGDAVQTYRDGDAFIGEDKNDPDWVWNLGNLETVASSSPSASSDGSGPVIGVENNFVLNDASDSPPREGGEIFLPFNYATIRFDKLTVNQSDYQTYSIGFDNSADLSDALGDDLSSADVVFVKTNQDEGLVVKSSLLSAPNTTSDIKTKEIFLFGEDASNLDVLYLDRNDNKIKLAGKIGNDTSLKFGEVNYHNTKSNDVSLRAFFSPSTNALNITLNPSTSDISNDDIVMKFGLSGFSIKSLGDSLSADEASEIVWNGTNIGGKDKDLRSKYGIIIRDTEDAGNNDEVALEIPGDEVKASILVYKEGKKTNQVIVTDSLPEIVMDSSVSNSENLILVGGPAVNSKVAELLGISFPLSEPSDKFKVNPGEALIKLVSKGNFNYLVIAGYTKDDTKKAVDIVSAPEKYSEVLKGKTETVINLGSVLKE